MSETDQSASANSRGSLLYRREVGALTWRGPAAMLLARAVLAVAAQAVVAAVFALRGSAMPWHDQINRIEAEAADRGVEVTIVIDLIHVLEYVWGAAWCFFDEADPAAEDWVRHRALAILEGKARQVATGIRRRASSKALPPTKRTKADACARYLINKANHLDYPTALESGRPIATGVIEGACRHLVKDRMDITGARWSSEGAEAVLKLRALRTNDDFEAYWRYHLEHERARLHASRYTDGLIPIPA